MTTPSHTSGSTDYLLGDFAVPERDGVAPVLRDLQDRMGRASLDAPARERITHAVRAAIAERASSRRSQQSHWQWGIGHLFSGLTGALVTALIALTILPQLLLDQGGAERETLFARRERTSQHPFEAAGEALDVPLEQKALEAPRVPPAPGPNVGRGAAPAATSGTAEDAATPPAEGPDAAPGTQLDEGSAASTRTEDIDGSTVQETRLSTALPLIPSSLVAYELGGAGGADPKLRAWTVHPPRLDVIDAELRDAWNVPPGATLPGPLSVEVSYDLREETDTTGSVYFLIPTLVFHGPNVTWRIQAKLTPPLPDAP